MSDELDTVQPGERIIWPLRGKFKIGCCDCGLVHTFTMRLARDGKGLPCVIVQAWRDEGLTKISRRRRKKA